MQRANSFSNHWPKFCTPFFPFVLKVCVISIQRVQNPPIYRSYTMKKQSMAEKNGNHKNERYLFHGTGYHNVKDICAHGFNRSFCGSNGETTPVPP